MTTAWTAEHAKSANEVTQSSFGFPAILLFATIAALLSFFSLSDKVSAVWHSGAFFDTDDAMRLVQVRALLHGQAWFDMTAKAMDPPAGVFLHWSRVVDVPLAAMIKGFGLFVDEATAEKLARLTFPFVLLVGLFLAMAKLGDILMGPGARLPALAVTLMSGNGISQFLPGRIDHHAPQIVILVTMLCALLTSLNAAKAHWAALAGCLAALSLAISLENLPFILFLSASLALVWVWEGASKAQALRSYGLGLALGLPTLFAATVDPSRYLLPVCDAFGAAHLGAGIIGTIGCVGLALASLHLTSRWRRGVAAVAIGGLALGFVAGLYPACLHDPFQGVDPLVREIWLSNVEEALTFKRLLQHDPATAWTSIVPVALGLLACLIAVWRSGGALRLKFLIVSGLVAAGLLLSLWQVRVFTSITAIALCGGLYVALSIRDWCRRTGRETLASLSLLLLFPFTATATAITLPRLSAPGPVTHATASAGTATSFDACLAPAAFAPLRTLVPGAVIAPIDVGSYLLVHTNMSVFAAAYHRNNDGNRFDYDIMGAPPAAAEQMARARHVTYVMTCPGLGETRDLADRYPGGLAEALLSKETPSWLERIDLKGTPFNVFRVRPEVH